MDIRNVLCLLMILVLSIQQGVCDDEDYEDFPAFGRCPWIRNKLKNGRVRYRYKGRVAKFLCDSGYELAGKRSSTCVRGQWSNPLPVCVARGCNRVPSIANGRLTEMYRGALLVYDCNPGYTLEGDSSIHCDGRRWNATSPFCSVSIPDPDTHCDFETYDLCGWTHDPTHDFDWKRNQFATPSGHVGTGPSYDHTFGENKAGYYLYIEASSPRKMNDTARIFSPVYPAEDSGGCFIFWYHMFGTHTGGIRVYLKPESQLFGELSPKWQKVGDQGNQWLRGNISIPVLNENFQIIIEGIRGEGYMGDSAIDDVQLTKFDCERMKDATQIITENTNADSCRGRCRGSDLSSSCGCNESCHAAENCCNDYMTLCFDVNETIVQNADEPLPGDYYGKDTSPATETVMPLETTEEKMRTSLRSLSPQITNQSPTAASPITHFPASSSIDSVFSNTTHSSLPTTIMTSSTDASTTTPTSTTTVLLTKSSTAQNQTETVLTTPTVSTAKTDTSKVDTTISSTTPKTTLKLTTTIGTTNSLKPSSSTTTTIRTNVFTTTTEHTTSTTPKTTHLPVTSTTTKTKILTATPLSTSTSTMSSTQSSTASNRTPSYINTETSTISSSISTNTTSVSPVSDISPSSTPRYNLRPRKTTTSSLSTDNYSKSTTLSATSLSTTTVTILKTEVSTVSPLLNSTPQTRRWLNFTVFPTATSGTTTAKTKTSNINQNVPETTKIRIPKPTIFTFPSTSPTTTDSFEMIASKGEPSKSGDSSVIAITVGVLIILCVIGGITYYFRKYIRKRQSKLDDDSEMRFLPENDYMEYSDASALDKILVN